MLIVGSPVSPYVRKILALLHLKGLDYEIDPITPFYGNDEFSRLSPLRRIPVLIDGDLVVNDSTVIAEYLDTLSPVGRLIPAIGKERAEVRCWEAIADGVLDAAILVRLESAFAGRTVEQRSQAWVEHQWGKVWAGLDTINQGLGKQLCMVGNGIHISLADVAVGCALAWLVFRYPELGWQSRYPDLAQLLARLEARPSFASTQPQV